jgi:NADPH2:quinone reductase
MYGTASKPKHDLVASLGAKPIDYKIEDFAAVVTAAGGVDAAFDAIGGDNFRRSFDTLKKDGTLVAYGYYNNAAGKGGSVPVDYLKLLFWNIMPNRRKTIFYSIVPERDKHPEWFKEDLTALVNLLAEGKIKPVIERRMELEQAAQAHELVEQAAVKGRLVLAVNDG